MYPLPLEAFECLEVRPFGHDGSVLLSIVTRALLCNFLCAGSPSLLPGDVDDDCWWDSRFLINGFRTGARHRCRAAKGGLHL
jgi:hypothetical protein